MSRGDWFLRLVQNSVMDQGNFDLLCSSQWLFLPKKKPLRPLSHKMAAEKATSPPNRR
jgi:hypothetical protein